MDTMDCMDNKKTVASLPQIILDVNEISGNCIYSKYNKQYHVRSEGKFSVTAKITGVLVKLLKICLYMFILLGLPAINNIYTYALMIYLRRTNIDFRHIQIDAVCDSHHQGVYNNPIQPLKDADKFSTIATSECNSARLLDLSEWGPTPAYISLTMELLFPCKNSCIRGKLIKIKDKWSI